VVKTVRRRRLGRVSYRVVFGTLEAVQQVLAACGWQINTAFIERVNLSMRQHVAAVGRRVSTLCKGEDALRQQLALYHTYYNFCLPHTSLRQPLPQSLPTNGSGSATQWRPCTPAMAAGLTDQTSPTHPGRMCGMKPTHARWDGLTQKGATAVEGAASQLHVVVAWDDTKLTILGASKGGACAVKRQSV
jgi:hypothetical protein